MYQVLESKGEAPKALLRCKEALDIFVGKTGSDTVEVAQLHAQMGVLHRAMDQDDLAQGHLKRSVEIFEKILGSDHPETQDARDILSTSTTPANTNACFDLGETEPEGGQAVGLDIGWGEPAADVAGGTEGEASGGDVADTLATPAGDNETKTGPVVEASAATVVDN